MPGARASRRPGAGRLPGGWRSSPRTWFHPGVSPGPCGLPCGFYALHLTGAPPGTRSPGSPVQRPIRSADTSRPLLPALLLLAAPRLRPGDDPRRRDRPERQPAPRPGHGQGPGLRDPRGHPHAHRPGRRLRPGADPRGVDRQQLDRPPQPERRDGARPGLDGRGPAALCGRVRPRR